MDITLPVTGGGLALAALYFVGKEAWKAGKAKVHKWDNHPIEDAAKFSAIEVAHTELKGEIGTINTKVDSLKEAVTGRAERIDKMDDKLDALLKHILESK